MKSIDFYISKLRTDLKNVSTEQKAESSRRYFPAGVNCIGANAPDVKLIIVNFHAGNADLTADEMLLITEKLLEQWEYSEEVLLAFGLINKFVKKNYSDGLLDRFEYWLENYTNNWSHVDDLCMKTIFQFLLSRPHLIVTTQRWSYSKISWCRRASNVVWVKFIKRKIGRSVYELDKNLVFQNCDLLMNDEDEFVQKSIGWLLKVTAAHHEEDVIKYIHKNFDVMTRHTLRYAIEKMDSDTRKSLLALTK